VLLCQLNDELRCADWSLLSLCCCVLCNHVLLNRINYLCTSYVQGWYRLNYNDYLSFFAQYLDVHISGAAALGKPLIVEEFNVISWCVEV
jgi:hypothetical protein